MNELVRSQEAQDSDYDHVSMKLAELELDPFIFSNFASAPVLSASSFVLRALPIGSERIAKSEGRWRQ